MLEGITVLSESIHSFSMGIFVLSLILIFILTGTLGVLIGFIEGSISLGSIIWLILFMLFGSFYGCAADKSTYKVYKVTMSKEVNFVEFMNKYEIISQEGEIYEIRERM